MYAKMEDEFAQLMAKAAANKDEARRELENVAKAKKLAEQKQRQEYERRRQLAEEARRKVQCESVSCCFSHCCKVVL
jgi:hypothetical protein